MQDRAAAGVQAEAPVLEARGLTMRFGPVEVLSDVSLTLEAGEVHAVIGENGAGKSTLMKILTGYLAPSLGAVAIGGASLRFSGPADAERRGVVLVHQEILLAPDLSVARNIFMGREITRGGLVDDRAMDPPRRSVPSRPIRCWPRSAPCGDAAWRSSTSPTGSRR